MHRILVQWGIDLENHVDIYCEDCDLGLLCEDITNNTIDMNKVLEAYKEHELYVAEHEEF